MKKIAVFTGTRAEYGLLYYLLTELKNHSEVELSLWAGGSHLSRQLGYTLDHIIADGFVVNEQLDFLLTANGPAATAKSLAQAVNLAADCFTRQQPDILVLLGDRYEALALAQTAMIFQIPVAHIHGGEITEGAMDDAIRHAITKMSHLHFTAAEPYRQRVIQLGENPSSVFNVGAPGLDCLTKMNFLSPAQLNEHYHFDFTQPYFLITYHPVTLNGADPALALQAMLTALTHFGGYRLIITYPNADTYGEQLINQLNEFAFNKNNVLLLESMGHTRYLSALKYATAVIGNSSSGIIEAPFFHVPTVNIGDRQKGRLASNSIIHSNDTAEAIQQAIYVAIELKNNAAITDYTSPYGQGNVAEKILKQLMNYQKPNNLYKQFYNIERNQ